MSNREQDRAFRSGKRAVWNEACPYDDPSLVEAWQRGIMDVSSAAGLPFDAGHRTAPRTERTIRNLLAEEMRRNLISFAAWDMGFPNGGRPRPQCRTCCRSRGCWAVVANGEHHCAMHGGADEPLRHWVAPPLALRRELRRRRKAYMSGESK